MDNKGYAHHNEELTNSERFGLNARGMRTPKPPGGSDSPVTPPPVILVTQETDSKLLNASSVGSDQRGKKTPGPMETRPNAKGVNTSSNTNSGGPNTATNKPLGMAEDARGITMPESVSSNQNQARNDLNVEASNQNAATSGSTSASTGRTESGTGNEAESSSGSDSGVPDSSGTTEGSVFETETTATTVETSNLSNNKKNRLKVHRPSVTISDPGARETRRRLAEFSIGEEGEEEEGKNTQMDFQGWDSRDHQISRGSSDLFSRPNTMHGKLHEYIKSNKGRDLTLGASFGYAICVAIVCFALLMSTTIADEAVESVLIQEFLCVMYGTSSLIMLVLLLLGGCDKLSNTQEYSDQKSTAFLRAGMIALGTGGFLYRATIVGSYLLSNDCEDHISFVTAIFGFIFNVLQMAFLVKYSKVQINRSLGLSIISRFMLMHIVATNLCIWISVIIEETVVEIHTSQNSTSSGHYKGEEGDSTVRNVYASGTDGDCVFQRELQGILAPYLFPLLIEFCVVASTMLIAIWESTGENSDLSGKSEASAGGLGSILEDPPTAGSTSRRSSVQFSNQQSVSQPAAQHHYNSYIGFIAGWIIIIGGIMVTLFGLYAIYTEAEYLNRVDDMVYGASLVVGLASLLVLPPTIYNMSQLTFKDVEIKRALYGDDASSHHSGVDASKMIERHLLSVTFMAVLTYRILCVIASVSGNINEWVLFADSLTIIVMAAAQTMFCNWFACHKRSTLESHLVDRPGFQGLQFLRCTNFALWFLNTLLLKDTDAKEDQIEVFGATAWAILSNIFQPLAILFYFHSFICMADFLHRSYTSKYIGVVRESKLFKKSRSTSVIRSPISDSNFRFHVHV